MKVQVELNILRPSGWGELEMDYEIFKVVAWLIFIWGILRLLKRKKK